MGRSRLALIGGVLALMTAPGLVRAQAPTPSPEDFAASAQATDVFEITEAQFVLAQTHNAAVHAFAQQMLDDHARSLKAFDAAALKSGLRPTRSMDADQARLLSGLQGETGASMDHDYLVQQINAHAAALVVLDAYTRQGSDPDLRQAAAASEPIVQHHLDMAKTLSKSVAP